MRTRREGHHGAEAAVSRMTPALWGEPERYDRDYWRKDSRDVYSGDSAHIDEDGYVWFAGRSDEISRDRRAPYRDHRGRKRVPDHQARGRVRRGRATRRYAR